MSTTVDYYFPTDRNAYSNFLQSRSDSNIFQTIEWKEFLENTFGYRPFYLVAKDKDENIRAILPLFYIKNFAGSRLESLPYSSYGGVLGEKKCINGLFNKAIKLKKELNCDYLLIKQFQGNGICKNLNNEIDLTHTQSRLTQFLRLNDPTILWNDLSRSVKRQIKKARNNDVTIHKVDNETDLNKAYHLDNVTKKRFGTPNISIKKYKNMWDILNLKGYVKIFIAQKNEMPIAYNIFLTFKDRLICLFGSPTLEGRNIGAHVLLLWRAINWSFEQGYSIFDFGITPLDQMNEIPDNFKGSFEFKKSFNASEQISSWYCYPGHVKKTDPLLNNNFMPKLVKKFLQKSPKYIYNKASSVILQRFV